MLEVKNAKISVIIPVFNKAPYIVECFESILHQTLQGFEVILVDDGSTDGSWEILCEYVRKDARFCAYRMEKNSGPGPARNLGIEKASGKYCLFCDADDAYPPYAFQVLVEHAEKYQADVACGNVFLMDEALKHYRALDALHAALTIKEEAVVRDLEHPALWWPLYHPKFLMNTSLLMDNDIRYPDMRQGEDPIFLTRVLCAAKSVALIPHCVYFYRFIEKDRFPDNSLRKTYLDHFSVMIDVFLRAGKVHCACLCYVISMYDWHSFPQWLRMSKAERAEDHDSFVAYAAKIQSCAPWEQDYAPYFVEMDALRQMESTYLKYGLGISSLCDVTRRVKHKLARLFFRVRACFA